ncbi:MAG: hypothetical protein HQK75_11800 [Candidatus Magnetomorum sp.]|nr:hypothetical protein [Candidatus Magnetomorum sp.]
MIRKTFILIVVCMTAYGCAITSHQKQAVLSFGKASENLGAIISKELPILRNDTINMNMVSLVLSGAVEPENLDSGLDSEDIAVRVAASDTLSNYGKLLVLLAQDDQSEKIKIASDELFSSVSRFNTTASQFDFTQLGNKYTELTNKPFFVSKFSPQIFGSIDRSIQGLGGIFQKIMLFYYHYKKANYMKTVVRLYKDEVNKICYLLMNDFSTKGNGFIRDYKNTIDILENSISGLRFMKNFQKRKAAVKGYRLLMENRARIENVAKNVETSLRELIDANNTLAQYMEDKKLSDLTNIKSLTIKIKDLAESIKIINN